ncbi:MAG: hypothetical protein VKJ04_01080 [Vampirovibrionales bacterium]|nr:hypothetical protein [Vampirovibrionales bacterium]
MPDIQTIPFSSTRTAGRPEAKLFQIGILTALVYSAFYVFYNTPALSEPRLNREIFTWVAAIVLGVLFCKGQGILKASIESTAGRGALYKLLAGFALFFSLFAVLTPNFHSTDLFGYINRGWQQWHYHSNPYVTLISDIPGWMQDPVITDHWVNNPSPYGFLYMMLAKWLCAVAAFFSNSQKSPFIAAFKAFNLLVFLFTAWLIPYTLKKTQGDQAALNALYLFAWNPLLLIHILMNGHNDILMGSSMAVVAVLALRGEPNKPHWIWLLPVLCGAILIKYAALVMLPFALLFLYRQKAYQALFWGGFLSGILAFGVAYPYLIDWQAFKLDRIQHNAQVSHSSFHAFFYHLYKNIAALMPTLKPYQNQVRQVLKNLFLAVYGILMLGLFLYASGIQQHPIIQRIYGKLKITRFLLKKTLDGFSAERFVAVSCYAVGALVCLITFKFYPWYLAMIFPMALLLDERHWFKRLLGWFTVSHLLSITFVGQAHVLNYLLMILLPTAVFFWRERQQTDLPHSHGNRVSPG